MHIITIVSATVSEAIFIVLDTTYILNGDIRFSRIQQDECHRVVPELQGAIQV